MIADRKPGTTFPVAQTENHMAWELRSGNEYFYRSRRKPGGRVTKEYFGNGMAAEIEARRMKDRAEQKRRDERAIMDFCLQVGPADQLLEVLDHKCRLLLEATLVAAGYHKRRSEWRRKGCQGRPRKKDRTAQQDHRASNKPQRSN
jgi:hypothetical protein